MRYRVLGPVQALDRDGRPLPLGDRQRALLAALLARAGDVVSVDRLVDLVWADSPPAEPAGALHSQVSRLRRMLGDGAIATQPPGYRLAAEPDAIDAGRFDALVAAAREAPAVEAAGLLKEALALWQGPAYAGFADSGIAQLEAIRLEEARLDCVEARAAALLEAGRPAEALPELEAFVAEHPLRERARALAMRVLYAQGRQADALRGYQSYRERLAADLGLEPSAAMQRLELQILRHELPGLAAPAGPPDRAGTWRGTRAATPLADLQTRYLTTPGGRTIAFATVGSGRPLVVLPAWVASIEVIGSGRDPRSALLQRLAGRVTLTLYDRYGTGLSRGPVDDFGLEPSVDELEAVIHRIGAPVHLLAMSQAGPVTIALAARRPELVGRLVLLGTYASGPELFPDPGLTGSLVEIVRAHWGFGSRLLADLYRPGVSDEGARHLARVLRDSASREVAAGYLQAIYDADVTALLPEVRAPALVLHYRGDRLIPFAGGRQLASGLPDARFLVLDGNYHLPDAADLDRVVEAICEFVGAPAGSR